MPGSIARRVDDSFNDGDRESVVKYTDWLLSSMNTISQNLRRIATLILLLVVVFELIVQSPKVEVSIGAFRITRNSAPLTFIPVIVAYLYFQLILDSVKLSELIAAFKAVFEKWSANAASNGLGLFISPAMPIYWNFSMSAPPSVKKRHNKLEDGISILLITTMLLGVLAFEGQAFYLLFNSNLSKDILWFISLCFSFALLLFAGTYYLIYKPMWV
jgi:hypothetical protein